MKSAAGCSTLLTEAGDLLAVNAGGPDVKSMTLVERSRRNFEAFWSTLAVISANTSGNVRFCWFTFCEMPHSWHSFCTLARMPELAVHAFTAALRRCSAFTVCCSSSGRELSHSFTDSRVSNVVKSAAGCSTLLGVAADLRAAAGASKASKR